MKGCNGAKEAKPLKGRIYAIESLSSLDGPGLRSVIFMAGCPLSCAYCHNPDSHNIYGGTEYTAQALTDKLLRYRPYLGKSGGVTASGGEPLLQAEFLTGLVPLIKQAELTFALDTSGCIYSAATQNLARLCDLVILDIKHSDAAEYEKLTGGGKLETTLKFKDFLLNNNIPFWARQVIIPGVNDTESQVRAFKKLAAGAAKTELLPFHNMASFKYEKLGKENPLKNTAPPSPELMKKLQLIISG